MATTQQLGLFVKHGLKQGQFFALEEHVRNYLIGRGPQATIHIDDQSPTAMAIGLCEMPTVPTAPISTATESSRMC